MRALRVGLGILWLALTLPSHAATAYLPVNQDPVLERDLALLAVLADMPSLSRPYSVSAVEAALNRIADSSPALHHRLHTQLAAWRSPLAVTGLAVSLHHAEGTGFLPNGYGTLWDVNSQIMAAGQWQPLSWVAVTAGAMSANARVEPTASLVSVGTDAFQWDLGYRTRWWSPLDGQAQVVSTQAQVLPSVTVSNPIPLQALGAAWQYEVFVAKLSRQPTLYQGQWSRESAPLLSGLALRVYPVPWWSLGAYRVFQFGGGNRPVDLGTLARAFYDPYGADNDASVEAESGNQVAAIASRMHFGAPVPLAIAVELAGEDTSNHRLYQLGNPAVSVGLELPSLLRDHLSARYAYSLWDVGWYANNIYDEGFTHRGAVLGHWAMQSQRDLHRAGAGQSQVIAGSWRDDDRFMTWQLRWATYDDKRFRNEWTHQISYHWLLPGLGEWELGSSLGRDALGEGRLRWSFGWRWR